MLGGIKWAAAGVQGAAQAVHKHYAGMAQKIKGNAEKLSRQINGHDPRYPQCGYSKLSGCHLEQARQGLNGAWNRVQSIGQGMLNAALHASKEFEIAFHRFLAPGIALNNTIWGGAFRGLQDYSAGECLQASDCIGRYWTIQEFNENYKQERKSGYRARTYYDAYSVATWIPAGPPSLVVLFQKVTGIMVLPVLIGSICLLQPFDCRVFLNTIPKHQCIREPCPDPINYLNPALQYRD